MRKVLFAVCIAAVIVALVASSTDAFAVPIVALDPLFGFVVLNSIPKPHEIPRNTPPVLPVASPRPPPHR